MSFSSELKVGLFLIIGAAVLIATSVMLKGNPFTSGKQHFYTLLENAKGVGERTQVRTSGLQVGEVTKVQILPDGARIDFDVDKNIKIPNGSVITLKDRGILGDVYIEIERRYNGVGFMKSGDLLPKDPEASDMASLMANLNSVVNDIKKVTANLADVLGTANGKDSIQNIVSNIEGITGDLREITSSQKMNAKEAIQAIRDSAVRISELLENNDSKINQIVSDVKAFTTQLRLLSTPENREKIENIIANVDKATASLQHMTTKMEKGEGTLGQLIVKDDTANQIKDTIKNINDVVKPITKLNLTLYDRAEANIVNESSNNTFTNEFNIILSTRPDRYYLLGVKNSIYGRFVTQNTTTTTVNGNNVVTTSQTNTPENIGNWLFNLQISQRFGPVGLRMGLFGSSAGFATDWYLFKNRLVASVEFNQFGGNPIPTDTLYGNRGPFDIKAFFNWYVFPSVFVTAGVDGLVLYDTPIPFAGAGFSITDDDIKGLVGVAAAAQ